MAHERIFLVALLVSGCVTEVSAIEADESCEYGAFHPNGEPRFTGDACYDDWAVRMAERRDELTALAAEVAPSCVLLAEATNKANTWSNEPDPVRRAAKACEALDASLAEGLTCGLSLDMDACSARVSCSGANEPPWLADLEEALPQVLAFCCEAGKMDVFQDPWAWIPGCELGLGTESCVDRMSHDSGLRAFADLVVASCEASSILAPSP